MSKPKCHVTAAVCTVCGRIYAASRSNQKYRSNECREAMRLMRYGKTRISGTLRYTVTCVVCGKPFMASYKNAKTCGRECYLTRQRQRAHAEYLASREAREKSAAKPHRDAITRAGFARLMAEINAPPPDDVPMRAWRF